FYAGSRVNQKDLLKRVEKMLEDGADFIDLGAQSSRPGAPEMPESEEKKVLRKALLEIRKEFPTALVSVDSYRYHVQKACLDLGSDIINNIGSDDNDEKIAPLSIEFGAAYLVMHIRGNPGNMSTKNQYQNVLQDVVFELAQKLQKLRLLGLSEVIIDPGFGFAKSPAQNFQFLKELAWFKHCFDEPLLVGLSRKSMLYKTLDSKAEDALNASTAAHVLALQNGAQILRVHDVKEAREAEKIHSAYLAASS
ncbi:MAG: dihydropteroate synthase, partial [Luteibaculum sp.]